MMLKEFRLRRFGRFHDDAWEFAPGLNVVRGPNEAGKSTMREAIVRLLLCEKKVDTSDSSFLALQRWGQVESFVIEGTLDTPDGCHHLVRDFEERRAEMRCESTGEVLRDEALIAERLHDLLGINSRGIYETTACLAQQEFAKLEEGSQVSQLLQQTVTGPGTESGAQSVLKELNSELSGMRRGLTRHAQNPGPVRAAMDQIEDLEGEIAALRPTVTRAEKARDRIERLEERLAEIDAELEQARRLRERAEQRREIEGKLADVRERCNELERRERQAERLSEEIKEVEERLEGLPEITEEQVEELRELERKHREARERAPELRDRAKQLAEEAEEAEKRVLEVEKQAPDEETVQHARDLSRDVSSLEESVDSREQDAAGAEKDLQSARQATSEVRNRLAIGAVLVIAGAGLGVGLGQAWPWLLAAIGIVVGIIGALRGPRMALDVAEERYEEASMRLEEASADLAMLEEKLSNLLQHEAAPDVETLARRANEARQAVEEAREARARTAAQAESALEEAEQAEQQAEIAEARLKGRLRQLEVESVAEFTQQASEVFELRKKLGTLESNLNGVLGDSSRAEIGDELSDLSSRRRGLEQQLESGEMVHAELTAEEFEELVTRINTLSSERKCIAAQIDEERGPAAHPEADPERLRRLEEELAVTQERLARLKERLAATELAYEMLEQAHRETLSAAIDVLEPRTSELLSAITGGRYAKVDFDRASLDPSVQCAEKGGEVDPNEELSCATREQVYLAARLALTDLLWPESHPPIILDDPFVNFDAERRDASVQIVRRLAADSQVLLFTCHEHYDELADHVIELPGPGSARA